MQFLWGKGQSKTVFPAVLGLLATYSEVWSDAYEEDESVDEEGQGIRTVPWIPEDMIAQMMSLGRARDEKGYLIGTKISIAQVLSQGLTSNQESMEPMEPMEPIKRFFRKNSQHSDSAYEECKEFLPQVVN